jgi:hypothetical protein
MLSLCPWVNFAMLIFNRLLWKRITFNAYYLPEKSTVTFNFTSYVFVMPTDNFQCLEPPGWQATDKFQRLVLAIPWTKSKEVTF